MRVKILNAMAQGIPILSTTLGCEGIKVVPGKNTLVADEPADFDAVLRLLDDADLAAKLASDGRRLAEEKYDYRQACCSLDDIYIRDQRLGV
jgi:glycosyltransferase involved in cell wall biosynthesis